MFALDLKFKMSPSSTGMMYSVGVSATRSGFMSTNVDPLYAMDNVSDSAAWINNLT